MTLSDPLHLLQNVHSNTWTRKSIKRESNATTQQIHGSIRSETKLEKLINKKSTKLFTLKKSVPSSGIIVSFFLREEESNNF